MKKTVGIGVLILMVLTCTGQQKSKQEVLRIGIFSSLYLDSAFIQKTYRFDQKIPSFLQKGLDFALGAQLAVDSLKIKKGTNLLFTLYDIRSKQQRLPQLQKKNIFDSLNLILTDLSGSDFKQLAEIACARKIPFISVVYPNDAGIRNCPSMFLLSPTLEVHIEKIYQQLRETEPLSNIIYVTKKGGLEARIKNVFDKSNQTKEKSRFLKWKVCNASDTLNAETLLPFLDSTAQNILLVGSLDEKFAARIMETILPLSVYDIHLYGMPSWHSLPELRSSKYADLPVYYTSAFFKESDSILPSFEQKYFEKSNSRPSEISYKAFEATYLFSSILMEKGPDVLRFIREPKYRVLTPFKFKPVYHEGSIPSYQENKFVYILKREKGILTKLNED